MSIEGSDSENNIGYRFWDFLKDWNTMKDEEKLKKYDEYACHEINIFLYFKDIIFFENVVKPFLKNKIQKTFVDFFLLDMKTEIIKYSEVSKISKLNYVCIFIKYSNIKIKNYKLIYFKLFYFTFIINSFKKKKKITFIFYIFQSKLYHNIFFVLRIHIRWKEIY